MSSMIRPSACEQAFFDPSPHPLCLSSLVAIGTAYLDLWPPHLACELTASSGLWSCSDESCDHTLASEAWVERQPGVPKTNTHTRTEGVCVCQVDQWGDGSCWHFDLLHCDQFASGCCHGDDASAKKKVASHFHVFHVSSYLRGTGSRLVQKRSTTGHTLIRKQTVPVHSWTGSPHRFPSLYWWTNSPLTHSLSFSLSLSHTTHKSLVCACVWLRFCVVCYGWV